MACAITHREMIAGIAFQELPSIVNTMDEKIAIVFEGRIISIAIHPYNLKYAKSPICSR